MKPGPRSYKQASLRIAVAQALPVEMWEQTREVLGVASTNRNRGEATALLHQTCAEADRAWLTLILSPEPAEDSTLTTNQLKRWYGKFGFEEIQAQPCLMARSPQRPIIARAA